MRQHQQRRLVPKFDEDENKNLNKNINETLSDLNEGIEECEKLLKNFEEEITRNNVEIRIKENMKQSLLTTFGNFTRKFKYNQELYIKKYKELGDDDINKYKTEEKQKNYLLMDENKELKKRDSEINILLTNMSNLTQTFKDLQTLVMEQGSILDRIDYNIDVAADNTTKGKKNIEKASQYQNKNCFRNVIIVILLIIFLEGFFMIIKYL